MNTKAEMKIDSDPVKYNSIQKSYLPPHPLSTAQEVLPRCLAYASRGVLGTVPLSGVDDIQNSRATSLDRR
jgi:hypothetical protein